MFDRVTALQNLCKRKLHFRVWELIFSHCHAILAKMETVEIELSGLCTIAGNVLS